MIGFRHVQQLLYNCCEGIVIIFVLSTAFDMGDCSLKYVCTSCMAYSFHFLLPDWGGGGRAAHPVSYAAFLCPQLLNIGMP